MKCLGCGAPINWDGKSLFAYTCPCGATILYDETTGYHPPASLIIGLHEKRELPHIDYYLGKSSHTSLEKEGAYKFLREKGCIWSWECDQCRERVIDRTVMEIANGLYAFEVHPSLKEEINKTITKKEAKQ